LVSSRSAATSVPESRALLAWQLTTALIPVNPLIDYYNYNPRGPNRKWKKLKVRNRDFTIINPELLALAMQKGKKYVNRTAKWALIYAATRYDHLLLEG